MFTELEKINRRPKPFEFYTAEDLWNDQYTSAQMLQYHLNQEVDLSSRNAKFIDRSVDWICDNFNVGAGARIIDFGCGPGLYTSRLAQKQADVTGVDFSQSSINYARDIAAGDNLPINYVNQNYLDFETDRRFDLAIMIMGDFCALSPAQRKIMLSKFHAILADGGRVLLDVYSLAEFSQRLESATYQENLLDSFWSPNKYYGFLNTFKYEQEKVTLDKYTIIEADRQRTVYNWLQYFSRETLAQEFNQCGLTVEQYLGDVAGSPYSEQNSEFAVIAKKM